MNPINRKNRNTLKGYFKKGDVPTEEQFAQLIDSTLNLVEDEPPTRTATGWSFFPKQGNSLDISLYTEKPASETEPPVWSLSVTPEKKLLIKNAQGETVVEASQDKSFILHGNLTVENTVTASVFKTKGGGGADPGEDYLTIPADKKWYDLPIVYSDEGFGSHVYEIYASSREQGTGLCQLTRVTAIWLNRMNQELESPQKHWWGWSGGVRFRWLERRGKPCLQMRSKKRLSSGEVHCRIIEMYKG